MVSPEKLKDWQKKRRDEFRKRIQQIKLEHGCARCGFKDHYAALDFHHRNPVEKKFLVSKGENYSWAMCEVEIVKCDILCKNCHSILECLKLLFSASRMT